MTRLEFLHIFYQILGTILGKLYLSCNIILNTTLQYQYFFIFKIEKYET